MSKAVSQFEKDCQALLALAKVNIEVEMLGSDSVEMRRRKLNPSPTATGLDPAVDNYSNSLA